MWQVINLYIDICLFKKGPQDLPFSIGLYRMTVAGYAVASLLIMSFLSMDMLPALTNVLIHFLLIWIFVWVILAFDRKIHRFYPTLSALLGTDMVISFCALPALAAVYALVQPGVFFLFLVLMVIWHLAVMGNIIRHALSKSLFSGLLLAFLFVFGSFFLMMLMVNPQV